MTTHAYRWPKARVIALRLVDLIFGTAAQQVPVTREEPGGARP